MKRNADLVQVPDGGVTKTLTAVVDAASPEVDGTLQGSRKRCQANG